MKNWKTTIGGALSALGTTLAGAGTVGSLAGTPSRLMLSITLAGFIISATGKFFAHLFAADAPEKEQPQMKLPGLGVLLLCVGLAFAVGCARSNVSGRILASTVQSVDVAMQGWTAYDASGLASSNDVANVRAAYVRYQLAESAAENAYLVAVKTGDKSAWDRAAAALRAASGDLLALIDTYEKRQTK